MFKNTAASFYLFIIALVALVLGIQYFGANSEFSNATSSTDVQISFPTDSLILQKNQTVYVDIFMKSTLKVSGATISVAFPPDLLEYQNPKDALFTSRTCSTYNRLKTFVTSSVNQEKGYVTVSRVSIEKTSELPSGYFCFGTLTFVPKQNGVMPVSALLKLDAALGKWQISGPQASSYIPTLLPEKSSLMITFDNTCSMKTSGDGNCDGVVDLTDFELWRKAFTAKKYIAEADFDNNKKITMTDFEIWRRGFYEYMAGTPTPAPTGGCIAPSPRCDATGYCSYPVMPPEGWCPTPPTPNPTGGCSQVSLVGITPINACATGGDYHGATYTCSDGFTDSLTDYRLCYSPDQWKTKAAQACHSRSCPSPMPDGEHMGWIRSVSKRTDGYYAAVELNRPVPVPMTTEPAAVSYPSVIPSPDIFNPPVILPATVDIKITDFIKLDPAIPVLSSGTTSSGALFELFSSKDLQRQWAREALYTFLIQSQEMQSLYLNTVVTPTCMPMPPCMLPGANPACAIKPAPGVTWCPLSPTPTPADCQWCGTSCVEPSNDMMCPMVMPPAGDVCKRVNGTCTVIKATPTPSPVVTCNWCGTFCTSSVNFANCPVVSPPAGMTCTQIGTGCRTVPAN